MTSLGSVHVAAQLNQQFHPIAKPEDLGDELRGEVFEGAYNGWCASV